MNIKLKRILSSILFFAVMLTAFIPAWLCSRVATDKSVVKTRARITSFYDQPENSLDVVYLGSSAVYRDIISVKNYADYGFTSMQFCTAAQPFKSTKYVLEEIAKTQNPQVYAIECRQLVKDALREINDVEITDEKEEYYYDSLIGSMKPSLNRYEMIKTLAPDDVFDWNFDFVRRHMSWTNMKPKKFIKRLFLRRTYSHFISTKCASITTVTNKFDKVDRSDDTEMFDAIPKETKAVLDDLIDYIKEKKITVMFFTSPYVQSSEQHKMENTVSAYLKKNGLDYFNCNNYYDDMGLDFSTDFSDSLHCNLLGAEKVTDLLGKHLNDNFIQYTPHTNETTISWNKSVDVWAKYRETLYGRLLKKRK